MLLKQKVKVVKNLKMKTLNIIGILKLSIDIKKLHILAELR